MKSRFLRLASIGPVVLMSLASACSTGNQASDLASNYPPNYSWSRRCVADETFELCQEVQSGTRSNLFVFYKGLLKDNGNLSVYVNLNGRDGTFPLDQRLQAQYPGPFMPATKLTDGALDCHMSPVNSQYICTWASDEMKEIFFYARNQWRFNAWDVQVAVVDGQGNWDSRFGENYRYRFEP